MPNVPGAAAAMAVAAMAYEGAGDGVAGANDVQAAIVGGAGAIGGQAAVPSAQQGSVSRGFAINVNNLRARGRGGRAGSHSSGSTGSAGSVRNSGAPTGMSLSFDNIMAVMMMQQQSEREERCADVEFRREELKAQALRDEMRRDELQAELRAQNERQNGFMQLIALSMVGDKKTNKRKRKDDKDDEDSTMSTQE